MSPLNNQTLLSRVAINLLNGSVTTQQSEDFDTACMPNGVTSLELVEGFAVMLCSDLIIYSRSDLSILSITKLPGNVRNTVTVLRGSQMTVFAAGQTQVYYSEFLISSQQPRLFFDPGNDYRTLVTSQVNTLQIQRLYYDFLLVRYTDESLLDYYLIEVCTMTQHWTPKTQRCGECPPGQFTLWFGQQSCLNCSDYSSLSVLISLERFYRDKVLAVCPNASATYNEAQMSGALLPLQVGAKPVVNSSVPANVTEESAAPTEALSVVAP